MKFLEFIKWIFFKMGENLSEQNRSFRRSLRDDTILTLFLWVIISLISSIVVFLILVGFQFATGINTTIHTWFSYLGLCVVYLVYTSVSVMYNTFKSERAELFETIKHGR